MNWHRPKQAVQFRICERFCSRDGLKVGSRPGKYEGDGKDDISHDVPPVVQEPYNTGSVSVALHPLPNWERRARFLQRVVRRQLQERAAITAAATAWILSEQIA
jgi:hypothetical protein